MKLQYPERLKIEDDVVPLTLLETKVKILKNRITTHTFNINSYHERISETIEAIDLCEKELEPYEKAIKVLKAAK